MPRQALCTAVRLLQRSGCCDYRQLDAQQVALGQEAPGYRDVGAHAIAFEHEVRAKTVTAI